MAEIKAADFLKYVPESLLEYVKPVIDQYTAIETYLKNPSGEKPEAPKKEFLVIFEKYIPSELYEKIANAHNTIVKRLQHEAPILLEETIKRNRNIADIVIILSEFLKQKESFAKMLVKDLKDNFLELTKKITGGDVEWVGRLDWDNKQNAIIMWIKKYGNELSKSPDALVFIIKLLIDQPSMPTFEKIIKKIDPDTKVQKNKAKAAERISKYIKNVK